MTLLKGMAACCNCTGIIDDYSHLMIDIALILDSTIVDFVLSVLFSRCMAGTTSRSELVSFVMTILAGDANAVNAAQKITKITVQPSNQTRFCVIVGASKMLAQLDALLDESLLSTIAPVLYDLIQRADTCDILQLPLAVCVAVGNVRGDINEQLARAVAVYLTTSLSTFENTVRQFATQSFISHPKIFELLLSECADLSSHDMQTVVSTMRSLSMMKHLQPTLVQHRQRVKDTIDIILNATTEYPSVRLDAEQMVAELSLILGAV